MNEVKEQLGLDHLPDRSLHRDITDITASCRADIIIDHLARCAPCSLMSQVTSTRSQDIEILVVHEANIETLKGFFCLLRDRGFQVQKHPKT